MLFLFFFFFAGGERVGCFLAFFGCFLGVLLVFLFCPFAFWILFFGSVWFCPSSYQLFFGFKISFRTQKAF